MPFLPANIPRRYAMVVPRQTCDVCLVSDLFAGRPVCCLLPSFPSRLPLDSVPSRLGPPPVLRPVITLCVRALATRSKAIYGWGFKEDYSIPRKKSLVTLKVSLTASLSRRLCGLWFLSLDSFVFVQVEYHNRVEWRKEESERLVREFGTLVPDGSQYKPAVAHLTRDGFWRLLLSFDPLKRGPLPVRFE